MGFWDSVWNCVVGLAEMTLACIAGATVGVYSVIELTKAVVLLIAIVATIAAIGAVAGYYTGELLGDNLAERQKFGPETGRTLGSTWIRDSRKIPSRTGRSLVWRPAERLPPQ